MELINTCRLVPSIYPPTGILDAVASPADLPFIFELESWTNDRISNELGILHAVPPDEWVTGKPMASVIMAAFCHPAAGGGRFNRPDRGAWYAALDLETAHAEVIHHRTLELQEVGILETKVQVRLYRADFHATFDDIRAGHDALHHPSDYGPPQTFGQERREAGSNGIVYRSVRRPGGECVVCFRPKLVDNVRPDAHFEYRWTGRPEPTVLRI